MNLLDHNILSCDAAFHLHNLRIDHKNNRVGVRGEESTDRSIFVNNVCDNGAFNIIVLSDNK